VQPPANQGIVFTQNVGQTSSQVSYLSTGGGYGLFLTGGGGLVMELTQPNAPAQTQNAVDQTGTTSVVSMQLAGGNADPAVQGEDPQTSTANYFLGQNSFTNVPQSGKVVYNNVYQNIGIEYSGEGDGLEYEFIVNPGAELSQIKLSFAGAGVSLDANGNLLLRTGVGDIVESAPTFYQLDAGNEVAVTGEFDLNADGTVGFMASGVNPAKTLYVDPYVEYAFLSAGYDDAGATATAIDPSGNVYSTGWTNSASFPTTTGSFDTTYGGGSEDAFVSKLNAANNQGYVTYLGGSGQDIGWGIAFDSAGDAYVTGSTSSSNFYTTPDGLASYNATGAYGSDSFVVKLDPTGSALLYSTVLDGTSSAEAYFPAEMIGATLTLENGGMDGGGIAIDAYGNAYVTGTTFDADFPIAGGGEAASSDGSAFIVELNASGSARLFSTGLGAGDTMGTSIAVDANYNIYAVGDTTYSDFTTTTLAYDPAGSGEEGYVVKISPSYAWDYRALLGDDPAHANAVAVNGSGNAFVAGDDFSGGNYHDYVLEMTTSGTTLVYDTNVITSSSSAGTATGISLDANGDAWVAGYDSSGTMSLVNDFASYPGGATEDGYLAEVDGNTHDIDFASYLGGDDDAATAVAQNPLGQLAIVGVAYSGDFSEEGFDISGGNLAMVVNVYNGDSSNPVAAPSIDGIAEGYSSYSPGILTASQNLEIEGTAPVGSTVTLYRDGVDVGDDIGVDGSGDWSYDDPDTLAQGAYDYTATDILDDATSDLSSSFYVTVDTTPPAVTITMASEITGTWPNVQVTASDIYGLSTSGLVDLYLDGSTHVAAEGNLVDGATFLYLSDLSLGSHYVVAKTDDLAGNQGVSATVTFDVVSSTWGLTDATQQFNPLGTNIDSHALDLDTSPGTDQSLDAALVYNSADISPEPTILANLQTGNSTSLPTTMTVDLTFGGVNQGSIVYNLGGYDPGDNIPISAQVTSAMATGIYTYTLDVSFTGGTSVAEQSISGVTFAVSENSGDFGAGWSFSALDELVPITTTTSLDPEGGVLRIAGDGTWSFYTEVSTVGSITYYTSPSGDFGTLTNDAGTWLYTTPDGEATVFNSSGQETSWTSADGFESIAAT
jgi:hypothetical protein